MSEEFYDGLNKIFNSFIETLNNCGKSKVLQEYFFELFESIFYASLIDTFFNNLTSKNLEEFGISLNSLENLKNEYHDVLNDVDEAIHFEYDRKLKKIDAKYYSNFKVRIKGDYPKLTKLINEIEKKIDIKLGESYLKDQKKKIEESGQETFDLHTQIITGMAVVNIKKNNVLFDENETKNKEILNKLIYDLAQKKFKSLKDFSKEWLSEQKNQREEFESILYNLWEEPLDLLESLIMVSLESVDKHRNKVLKKGFKEDIKFNTLIRIHARALRISNEILTLLKAGYPDGAYARWRSLHELSVVSMFLFDNDNNVSQRYLEHNTILIYKEALNYQEYCEELKYEPVDEEFLDKLKTKKDELCNKYGKDFNNDWGWIPRNLVKNQSFTSLEKDIGLGKLHPFYKSSSAHVHGNSRGFYTYGLTDDSQNEILSIGASNYGLADALQSTAISLMQISSCLLSFEEDGESLTNMKLGDYYVKEIKIKSVEIQKGIEEKDIEYENKLNRL